jgi:hypothetical protein
MVPQALVRVLTHFSNLERLLTTKRGVIALHRESSSAYLEDCALSATT